VESSGPGDTWLFDDLNRLIKGVRCTGTDRLPNRFDHVSLRLQLRATGRRHMGDMLFQDRAVEIVGAVTERTCASFSPIPPNRP